MPLTAQEINEHKGAVFTAGGVTGIITKTSVAPLERIKVLFQLQGPGACEGPPKYRGVGQTIRTIWQEEGLRGYYRGNGANCVRIVPVYAIKFATNDLIKGWIQGGSQAPLGLGGLIAAGSIAGLVQCCATYPLELVYTRLCMSAKMGTRYSGIADCFRRTAATEGVAALYKGFAVSLTSAIPFVAFQMTGYELMKRLAVWASGGGESGTYSKPSSVLVTMLCGAVSGVFAQTSVYPFDTVRKRMQVQGLNGRPRVYHNSFQCAKGIFLSEGFRGFYGGCLTNVIRAVPEAAIQFALFDAVRDSFVNLAIAKKSLS